MAIPTTLAPKLARLIAMLSSDNDGEVLAAVAALRRTLASVKCDLHDIAALIDGGPTEPKPRNWGELARWCRRYADELNDREATFVNDMAARLWGQKTPTEKQAKWLREIYERLSRGGRR